MTPTRWYCTACETYADAPGVCHGRPRNEIPGDDNAGLLESSSGDWDENGFHLRLVATDDSIHVRICGVEEARELVSAIAALVPWIAEHDRERAAYDRATPEERDRVLGRPRPDYDPRIDWPERFTDGPI